MGDYNIKVLIVDDSSTIRRILKNILSGIGFKDIIEAADGVEALMKLGGNPDIGLILSDWNMPNMNGLDFLKKVREKDPEKKIPFIMVTTEAEKTNVIEAIKAGANNYVVKPFTPDVIKQKIDQVLSKK